MVFNSELYWQSKFGGLFISTHKVRCELIECHFSRNKIDLAKGFQVFGYKSSTDRDKVGFILSSIKVLSFMDENNDKIRVRIRLLKDAIEVRQELKNMQNIFPPVAGIMIRLVET